jgi:hypothetical protein
VLVSILLGSASSSDLNFALPRNIQREKTSPNRSGLDRNETAAPRRPGNPAGYLAGKAIQIGEDTPQRASSVMRQRESPVQNILGIPILIIARAASKNQVIQALCGPQEKLNLYGFERKLNPAILGSGENAGIE